MKKKILIVYCSFGSGHKTIAEVVEKYFLENSDCEVKILDVTKYSNTLGKISVKIFNHIINHRSEFIFNLAYEVVDNKIGSLNQIGFVKKAFNNELLKKEIVEFNPDLTVSTHFWASNIVSYYNKIGLIKSKVITIITDYISHSFWRKYHEYQDGFIVANDIVKNEMIEKGVDGKKIHPFGLPIDRNKLLNLKAKSLIRKKYNIDKDKETFLFFGGGSAGSMAYYEYFKLLVKSNYPINIIFICGKNAVLENKSRAYVVKNNLINVKVLGFVKDVYSLLNISDFVITKPGGATITECLEMHVPMVLVPGFGGQEKYNARFVAKKKYGLKTRTPIGLNHTIKKLIKNDNYRIKYKTNLEKVEPNDSTKKIFDLCMGMLKK
ncbi:MAG: glycosyltransferase [Bacilli bacterium]